MKGLLDEIKFDEHGLVTVVVQDHRSNEVLMVAYMNREALERTGKTGMMHYWSRSRRKLWLKGETSGHYQYVRSIRLDCDGDALLAKVEQTTAACHTGNYSCFYREADGDGLKMTAAPASDGAVEKKDDGKAAVLQEVFDIISDRRIHPKEGSYTNYLFEKGLDKILKKVGEETAEVIIAAKNESREEIRYEAADLLYHLFVLLAERGMTPDDIYDELRSRR